MAFAVIRLTGEEALPLTEIREANGTTRRTQCVLLHLLDTLVSLSLAHRTICSLAKTFVIRHGGSDTEITQGARARWRRVRRCVSRGP